MAQDTSLLVALLLPQDLLTAHQHKSLISCSIAVSAVSQYTLLMNMHMCEYQCWGKGHWYLHLRF